MRLEEDFVPNAGMIEANPREETLHVERMEARYLCEKNPDKLIQK